ncbi:MAG: tetratricopeptide repeat protein [Planctomycetota bacterium]
MPNLSTVLLPCGLSAAVAAMTALALVAGRQSPPDPPATVSAATGAELAAELRADLQGLKLRLADLEAAPERTEARSTLVDPEQIRALVASALQEQRSGSDALGDARAATAAPKSVGPLSPEELAKQLGPLLASGESTRSVWEQILESGQTDEVLDVFRAHVDDAPGSVAAHHDLARAVHAAAMADPNHAGGGLWRESDDAYSSVLDLDPQNWTARYEKAVKLSFWPATYGRHPEAIGHFEKLIAQQETMPAESEHARVYYMLGNLCAQRGETERAAQIWRRGLARHPASTDLQKQLATLAR